MVLNANVFAQKTKKRVKDPDALPKSGFFIKTHPLGFLYGPNVGLEYILNTKSTLQFEVAYLTNVAPRTADAPNEKIIASTSTAFDLKTYYLNNFIKVKSGIDFRLGYKFFTENWANGYYVMPQIRYRTNGYDLVVPIANGDIYNSIYQKTAISGAVLFGYQKFYNSRIFFDVYGGLGRSQTTESYTFGGGPKPVSTWADNYNETYNSFSWNLHVGLMVGYRFGKGTVSKNVSTTQKNGTGLLD